MENFKIRNFKNDNPEKNFPAVRSLGLGEIKSICLNLSERFALTLESATITIDKREVLLEGFNANDEMFKLHKALSFLDIVPRAEVYINWHRFDNIDELSFADLDSYFTYIWYPGSDDIDIFDASFDWILSVSHEGYLKYVQR